MSGLDATVALVGRETTAELVEQLVRYDAKAQLPVIVLYGPGGVGKTAVIDHVERRFDRAVPLARVDFDVPLSKNTWDVLEAVYQQLAGDYGDQFGRLRLRRFELARAIRSTLPPTSREARAEDAPAPSLEAQRRAIRELLARRLTSLDTVVTAVTDAAAVAPPPGFLVRLFQPVLRRLTAMTMTAPRTLRWLLTGKPRNAAALTWFEKAARKLFTNLGDGARIDDIVLHIQQQFETLTGAEAALDKWQRLALAALLADLRAAYRFRWPRRVNCVLLLDDADLLAPDSAERMALRGEPVEAPSGPDFLDLLAEQMAEKPKTPLLVVATKQSGAPAGAHVEPADSDVDPVERARHRYDDWRLARERKTGDILLPIKLAYFDLERTRRFFLEVHRRSDTTTLTGRQVRELHYVTHGNPLALRLASDRMDWSFRRSRQIPSVRDTFDMRVPAGERGADLEDTVRSYLILRMLHRFRASVADDGDQDEIRKRTIELFTRLAATPRLDERVVRLMVGDEDAVVQIVEALDTLSFVSSGPEIPGVGRTWVLDPLLRDLLAIELLHNGGGDGYSYVEVHRMLAELFETDPADRLRADYHRLALGEIRGVAANVALRASAGDRSWQRDVVKFLATAPMNGQLPTQTMPGNDPFADLVRSMQMLYSCTSAKSWSAENLDQLDQAQQNLPGVSSGEFRRFHPAFSRLPSMAPDEEPLPESSSASQYKPSRGFRPGTVRRGATGLVAASLVAYSVVYATYVFSDCEQENPWEVGPVLAASADHPMRLENRAGQCIGLAAEPSAFSEQDGALSADQREIKALSGLIAEQNALVAERSAAEPKRPYVTIVVATMLSATGDGPRRDVSVGVNELRGAYLAQREWNNFGSSELPPPFFLRIVLANFGGNSDYADDVAEDIRRFAVEDPSVLAVTGFGQTRTSTERAAELLAPSPGRPGAAVPMVASAASGNGFTGKPYFFRIASTNSAQARFVAAFAKRQFPEHKPYLLYDATDAYGNDLAREQEISLRELDFSPSLRMYQTGGVDSAVALRQRVDEICGEASGAGPVIFYAGRANELPTVLETLRGQSCGQRPVVLGGDDLSQLETAGWQDFQYRSWLYERLYYVSYGPSGPDLSTAATNEWESICERELGLLGTDERCEFYRDYEAVSRSQQWPVLRTGVNGHILVAYDAVNLVLRAAGRANLEGKDPRGRRDLWRQLGNVTASDPFRGVSGAVFFDPANSGGDPVNKLMVVQTLRDSGDAPHPVVVDFQGDP